MKTINLYIEPASLPVPHQLAHYAAGCHDQDALNIIMLQRLAINCEVLNNNNTLFVGNIYENQTARFEKIAAFILKNQPFKLNIHTNLFHTQRLLLPLLQRIAPAADKHNIKLFLYDDGTAGLTEREQIKTIQHNKLPEAINAWTRALNKAVFQGVMDKSIAEWSAFHSYLWHHVFETTYYLLKPSLLASAKNSFFSSLLPRCQEMRLNHHQLLSGKALTVYRQLFALPDFLHQELSHRCSDSRAMIFLSTYVWSSEERQAAHHKALLDKITELKDQGQIPPSQHIVFKGHPENKKYNAEIIRTLGNETLALPDSMPAEALYMNGLLPDNIAGCFSTVFFSLEGKRVPFVIFNEDDKSEASRLMRKLLISQQIVSEQNVHFLDEQRFLSALPCA